MGPEDRHLHLRRGCDPWPHGRLQRPLQRDGRGGGRRGKWRLGHGMGGGRSGDRVMVVRGRQASGRERLRARRRDAAQGEVRAAILQHPQPHRRPPRPVPHLPRRSLGRSAGVAAALRPCLPRCLRCSVLRDATIGSRLPHVPLRHRGRRGLVARDGRCLCLTPGPQSRAGGPTPALSTTLRCQTVPGLFRRRAAHHLRAAERVRAVVFPAPRP
mmetsp:Transcript_84452/g.244138  ORF Transcript_84452/g.244138 Transcript_84452/m.244138 type:complete len:214 (-) Transcript_84452:251-892(-)